MINKIEKTVTRLAKKKKREKIPITKSGMKEGTLLLTLNK